MRCEFAPFTRNHKYPQGEFWVTVDLYGDGNEIVEVHVLPINDSDGHSQGLTCRCEPAIWYNKQTGVPVVTHNSFDGREALEEARNILNKMQDHG